MAVIQFLLDKGADIKARDEYKWTPLHMAAESNKADAVKLLIDRGAVIDARDGDWRTALHRAAEHNSVNAIKVLLKIAPETLIPAGDNCGETAKAVAISMGHKEAVQMIEHYE
jgi:ankyrin repeat protein